jgi:hypothetical protein
VKGEKVNGEDGRKYERKIQGVNMTRMYGNITTKPFICTINIH